MVDRVVLVAVDEPQQVRDLDADVAVVGDQRAQALAEVDDVRHVGEDVVRDDQVGPAVLSATLAPVSSPRNITSVGTPLATAASATFAAGSMPSDRMPRRDAVLEQVAVVAGDLDDERVAVQAQALRGLVDELLRVPHPRVGVGREVGVVGEDVLGRDVRGQLDQQALRSRPARAAGRRSPPGRAGRRTGSSRRVATSRGRRTCA